MGKKNSRELYMEITRIIDSVSQEPEYRVEYLENKEALSLLLMKAIDVATEGSEAERLKKLEKVKKKVHRVISEIKNEFLIEDNNNELLLIKGDISDPAYNKMPDTQATMQNNDDDMSADYLRGVLEKIQALIDIVVPRISAHPEMNELLSNVLVAQLALSKLQIAEDPEIQKRVDQIAMIAKEIIKMTGQEHEKINQHVHEYIGKKIISTMPQQEMMSQWKQSKEKNKKHKKNRHTVYETSSVKEKQNKNKL